MSGDLVGFLLVDGIVLASVLFHRQLESNGFGESDQKGAILREALQSIRHDH